MNKQKIICKPLDSNYIKIAVEMAQENYDLEKQSVTALGSMDNRAFFLLRLFVKTVHIEKRV